MAATTSSAPAMTIPKATASSHPYTCNTCQVAFKGSELQRGHMQSDWHRYNLKRRVASLPPLTSEIFAEKVLANQASAAATAARASFERICAACERTYYSQNAYTNHLQSQKHKARLIQLANEPDISTEAETESMMSSTYSLGRTPAAAPSDDEDEDDDSDGEHEFARVIDGIKQTHLEEDDSEEEDPITRRPTRPHHSANSTSTATPAPESISSAPSADPTLQCLFCNAASLDIPANILHMSKSHGLFVPEQEYLVDLPGLLSYLHDRVHALHECLYCGQLKYTATGIQTHMRDKGHCMIAFESEAEMVEVGEFYDFRSTYSDDEDSEEDTESESPTNKSNGAKLGATRATKTTTADGEAVSDEEDWEEDSDADDDTDGNKAETTPKARKSTRNQAFEFDGELHLPSGRTAGHRSLARYYRQNLHNYPTAAERLAMQHEARRRTIEEIEDDSDVDSNPHNTEENTDRRVQRGRGDRAVATRANGGLGLMSAPEHVKRAAAKMEIKEKRKEQRAWNKFKAGNERQNNNQKHFRDPLLQ